MDNNSYEAEVPPLAYSHAGQGSVFRSLDANPTLNQLAHQLRELVNKNPDSALSQCELLNLTNGLLSNLNLAFNCHANCCRGCFIREILKLA
jgi:hypothetical protein